MEMGRYFEYSTLADSTIRKIYPNVESIIVHAPCKTRDGLSPVVIFKCGTDSISQFSTLPTQRRRRPKIGFESTELTTNDVTTNIISSTLSEIHQNLTQTTTDLMFIVHTSISVDILIISLVSSGAFLLTSTTCCMCRKRLVSCFKCRPCGTHRRCETTVSSLTTEMNKLSLSSLDSEIEIWTHGKRE